MTGEATAPPHPAPLYTDTDLTKPTAIAIDAENRCYVLCIGPVSGSQDQRSILHQFTPPNYDHSVVIGQGDPVLPALHPVDMVLEERESRRFLILDRGSHQGTQTSPKLVIVNETPLTTVTRQLNGLIEPTALAQDPIDGKLVLADSREPRRTTDRDDQPADLFQVNPDTGEVTSLLSDVPSNPLIFPTGLVFERHQVLIVCDRGVRQKTVSGGGQGYLVKAEPAALYRIDLSQSPPTISRITSDRRLVYPTKIARDLNGDLLITDRGTTYEPSASTNIDWRTRPNTFGISVLFSQERPVDRTERNRIRFDISQLIDKQKPAHTSWWLDDRKLYLIHHI